MSEYITLKEGDELRPTDEIRNVGRLIDWREAIWGGRILFIDIHEGWEFRRPVEPQDSAREAITALIRSGFSPAALTAALAAYEGGSK